MRYWRRLVLLSSITGLSCAVGAPSALAAAVSASQTADYSSDETDDSPMMLQPMVVTASRTLEPLANTTMRTQVLEGEDIERLQSRDLADALRLVPGIQLREIHGRTGKEVHLQGFNGDRVLVLVNGQPVSATTGSTVDVTQLTALDVERIEVVPGAASSLYGSAAMGGVVNVITRQQPSQLRLLSEAGSYGDDELSDSLAPQRHYLVSAGLNSEAWSGQVSIDRRDSSEVDLNPDSYASNGFDGSKTNSNAQLGYHWNTSDANSGGVNVGVSHYLEDLQQRLSETTNKYEDLVRRGINLSAYQNSANGRFGLTAMAQQQYDATLQENTDSNIDAGRLQRQAHYRQQKVSAEWSSAGDLLSLANGPTLQLVAGIEHFREDIKQHKRQLKLGDLQDYETDTDDASDGVVVTDSITYTDIGDGLLEMRSVEVGGKRNSTDVFSQATLGLGPKNPDSGAADFTVGVGLRAQYDSDFGSHLAPTLSARQNWSMGGDWQLQTRQSWGAGYRVGNLKERHYTFDHSIYGYIVEGNPDLEPERSVSTQASVLVTNKYSWHVEMSVFQNRIGDLIETENTGTTDPSTGATIYSYGNIEEARTRGYELSSQWQINRDLQQRVSFSYLDARDLGSDLPLPNRAKHHAKLIWLWDASDNINLNLMGEYEGSFYSSVTETALETSPAYWRWDLTASLSSAWYGFDQRWFGGIKNLTDSVRSGDDNYDRRPTEGRYIYAGFDFRF